MDQHDLTGYYTYRSLLNEPGPTDDFYAGPVRPGRAVLVGRARRSDPRHAGLPRGLAGAGEGRHGRHRAGHLQSPVTVELDGVGRPGTGTADFDYRYQAALASTFSQAVAQRPTLVGTALRAKLIGAGAGRRYGQPGRRAAGLPPPADPRGRAHPPGGPDARLARHRLQHADWHTVRG